MANYKFTAVTANGERINGMLDAESEMSALEMIREAYDAVLLLEPASRSAGGKELLSKDLGKTPLKALAVMCFQFSTILESGLPIARSIQMIAEETKGKGLQQILRNVAADVEAGSSMAESFEKHGKKKIPVTFIETVRAGEDSGNLSESFRSLYSHYDRQMKIRRQIRSLIIYPVFVLVIAVCVVIAMMIFVVPAFNDFFDYYGGDLPGITKALIGMSDFFQRNFLWILLVIMVLVTAYKAIGSTEKGRRKIGRAKLKMPVLGKLVKLKNASEFSSTMAIMLNSGISITRAVSITSKVMSNPFLSCGVRDIVPRIESGDSLSNALRQLTDFPNILVSMVTVGEKTGELKSSLGKSAVYYEEEYAMGVNRTVSSLSPAILVFTAAFAGFIVIAMYMSMFTLYSVL